MSSIIETLFEKQERLKHAFIIVEDIDPEAGTVHINEYHYKTCEKCRLRRELGLPIHTREQILHGD